MTTVFAPPAEGLETLSFIGVGFNAGEKVFLVRITSGNVALGNKGVSGSGDLDGGPDLVVMDDFIYGEPKALQ